MIRTQEEHLAHYGILRRSGRYPWGSGSTQSQRNRSFLDTINEELKKDSEATVARNHGISVADLRGAKSIALHQQRQEKILTASRLRDKGWSHEAIGQRMGHPESTIRGWLAPGAKDKADVLQRTSGMLKDQLTTKKAIDVGLGVEADLGITRSRLDNSIAVLKEQGYTVHNIKVPQQTTGKFTNQRVLARPGITKDYLNKNRAEIKQISEYSEDQGRTYFKPQPPLSVSSKRVDVIYAPEGAKTDGMIYVRPGVKDLSIGNKTYGQVRIMIDDTHYLKGMAIYKEDLPPGKDLQFSTKQHRTNRKKDAMKPLEKDAEGNVDPELPFGSIVRQKHGPDGKVISAINMVGSKEGAGEEGAWATWKIGLSSQMLSKQDTRLAKQQLGITYDRRHREFHEINSLTNPTVRKDLLLKFADSTDAAAMHLAAAALPRQANKVLLPIPSMKPDQIYAPGFRQGERVVLIRHPHGGKFEIPELTVNNNNREARKLLGRNPEDAVGIHHKVAERLSGADFDGDTVLVIPNPKGVIKHDPALEGLKNFDPMVYKIPKDSTIKRMDSQSKGYQMGNVSNLITDMTLQGAGTDHMARAIKHSMVVIDAQNHELDWKQSEKDHGILDLKQEYQGGKQRGATTLISRAGGDVWEPQREARRAARGGPIDPATGRKVFEPTGFMIPETKLVKDPRTGKRSRVQTGRMVPKQEKFERLALAEDAFSIIPERHTPTPMEIVYANHSNSLKALANTARKEAVPIKGTVQSKSAKKVYAKEVSSLNAKLRHAEKNAPREREANALAERQVSQRRQANPGMNASDLKKIKNQALITARLRTGAHKDKIEITQSEWDAIQAGAISTSKLEKILKNSNPATIKTLAMPKPTFKMTSAKRLRAQRMAEDGYTQQEIADHLGVGLTTLKIALNE